MPELSTVDQLLESAWGDVVPWNDYPSNDWSNDSLNGSRGTMFASINDRQDGKFPPFYENETDLAKQLGMVRRFLGLSELCEAVTTALRVYTFGAGVEISVQAAAKTNVAPELVDAVRRIVENFSEDNCLVNSLDLEIHQRSREDGEAILPIERVGTKIVCNPVETVQLTEPSNSRGLTDYIAAQHGVDCDTFSPSWKFGVLTTERNTASPLGYHVVYDTLGNDWDFYPPEQLVHVKRGVPRSAKRGISDWIAPMQRMSQHAKLVRNIASGEALRAAIAWVEQVPLGTTAAQAASRGGPGIGQQYTTGRGESVTPRAKTYREGTILRPTGGLEYKPFLGSTGMSEGLIRVQEMLTGLIGTRWLMTRSMISGDASAVNFAASLTAEAPFVKAREADQQLYGGALKSLLWKVVKFAWRLGWLDTRGVPIDQLEKLIDIKVDFTSPATRDRTALVNQLVQEVGLLGTSKRTAQVELGRDPDEETAASDSDGTAIATDATGVVVDGGGENVAASALNGAQIASLMDILDAVTSKRIPAETALATMQAAFPSLGADVLNGILNPLVGYVSPILADGTPNPAASTADATGATGEMANISTQQWNRNTKAIRKILDEFKTGGSRVIAKGMLTALSIPDAKAEEYLDDAADGSIDSPELSDTEQAAVTAALESVETTDEARQVLESLRQYP